VQAAHPDWFSEHKIKMLMQIGLQPNPKLKGIPFGMDYAKTEDDKRVLRLIVGWTIMGRPFLAPPGIPADRKVALRKAFDETMRDPAFLADAAKSRLDIGPISGAKIDEFLADVYATPKPLIDRAGKILASGK
jgi:hypothetical protein